MGTKYVFLADGFEEVEALAPVDIMRRAGLSVALVSVTDDLTVCGSHDVQVLADCLFEGLDYEDADLLFLPGGMPGAAHLFEHAGLHTLILQKDAEEVLLAAICAAPFIYGELGLLEGRKATCYPGFEEHMKGALLQDSLIVKDAHFYTGCGPAASFEMGFALVEHFCGKEKADELRAKMQFGRC